MMRLEVVANKKYQPTLTQSRLPCYPGNVANISSESRDAVDRHKTAIVRSAISRPVQQALSDQVIAPGLTFFDYGCGRGTDVRLLRDLGYEVAGWDPEYAPAVPKRKADVVNLGYVVNVVEDPRERVATLQEAYSLAERCLIVAAQLSGSVRESDGEQFADGILTRRNTFQKYYSQEELRTFIGSALDAEPIAAAPGVYYVFRDEAAQQSLLLKQVSRRRTSAPRAVKTLAERFAPHLDLLRGFAGRVEELGRIPREAEYSPLTALSEIGSPKRCIRICERLFDGFSFEEFRDRASQDLLVYIALSRFHRRPKFGALPETLQWDIRDFFGSYTKACERGDSLLFRTGSEDEINAVCSISKIGKLLPRALYVHCSAVGSLDPLLRVYLGCGRALVGDTGANVLKIHRFSGKISYLFYPTFDEAPHPSLMRSLSVNLRTRETWERDYSTSVNPPILHRKETLVGASYPHFDEFVSLTRAEEEAGLLDVTESIGFTEQWNGLLKAKGLRLEGHRLMSLPPLP